jgi:hypothetical protein
MSQTQEAVFFHGDNALRLDYVPSGTAMVNGEIRHLGGGITAICTSPEGIAVNARGSVAVDKVWKILKDGSSGPVFAKGDRVVWDASANLAIVVPAAGLMDPSDWVIGIAVEAAGTNQDYVIVDVIPGIGAGASASGLKMITGLHTTVAASDTIITGLATVIGVVASMVSTPVDGAMHVTADIGDQAGTPAAGSILLKTWKSTDGDATLVAATTFTLKVSYIAFGY